MFPVVFLCFLPSSKSPTSFEGVVEDRMDLMVLTLGMKKDLTAFLLTALY